MGALDAHVPAGAAQARFLNSLGDMGKGNLFFVERADQDAGQAGSWRQPVFIRIGRDGLSFPTPAGAWTATGRVLPK
jgi:hypothetical protein